MTEDEQRAALVQKLAQVIAWEMHAQAGVERPPDRVPALIADSLLDYFDIEAKQGVVLPR